MENQIWYEYLYKNSSEMYEIFSQLSELSFAWQISILISILLSIALVYFIIPSIIIAYKYYKKAYELKKRNNLLERLKMQKFVEDDIEREFKMEDQRRIEEKLHLSGERLKELWEA